MRKSNILAIIQARMGSSRLPGKVLLDISGEPMLVRVAERARRSKTLDGIIIATTVDPSDNPIASLCAQRGYPFYRGSTFDVLDRYYQTARKYEADVIVRITGDCPVIDPHVIDTTVYAIFGKTSHKLESDLSQEIPELLWDFTANRLPPPWRRTYPIGLDTEVCTFRALERTWREADQPHQREHVMPYIYDPARSVHFSSLNTLLPPADLPPDIFRVLQVDHEPDLGALRWTVDTAEDLDLIRQIYTHFDGRDGFSWLDVLALVQQNPELARINASVLHKSVHDVDSRNHS